MALVDDIRCDVTSTISTGWKVRNGRTVPSTESIVLAGGAVEIGATFLYADLANSSRLARDLNRRVAAKILKSFLATTTRLIRARGGTVVSFDGDRVLGVFVGGAKNTNAAKCALQIKWTVQSVIRVRFETAYKTVRNLGFRIAHGVGIDTGTVLMVRAGARGDNDLISIGRAPSLAAKLSELREGSYQSFMTASVYNQLADSSKFGGKPRKNMWERRSWEFLGRKMTVYRSSWWWEP